MAGRGREISRPELCDREWLVEHYVRRELTAQEIADYLGVAKPTVRLHLRRNGIALRPPARRFQLSEEQAAELVLAYQAGRSLDDVGREFGLTVSGAAKYLERAGVPRRPSAQTGRRKAKCWDALVSGDWLEREYLVHGKSMGQIAREQGCSHSTVRKAIFFKGITPRANARPTGARTLSARHAQQLRNELKRCAMCDKTSDLEVHHRDADRSNNERENLLLLCRDCHAIAEWLIRPVEARLRQAYRLDAAIA